MSSMIVVPRITIVHYILLSLLLHYHDLSIIIYLDQNRMYASQSVDHHHYHHHHHHHHPMLFHCL